MYVEQDKWSTGDGDTMARWSSVAGLTAGQKGPAPVTFGGEEGWSSEESSRLVEQ